MELVPDTTYRHYQECLLEFVAKFNCRRTKVVRIIFNVTEFDWMFREGLLSLIHTMTFRTVSNHEDLQIPTLFYLFLY